MAPQQVRPQTSVATTEEIRDLILIATTKPLLGVRWEMEGAKRSKKSRYRRFHLSQRCLTDPKTKVNSRKPGVWTCVNLQVKDTSIVVNNRKGKLPLWHTLRACEFSEGLEGWGMYQKKYCCLAKCFDSTPIWLCTDGLVDEVDRLLVCPRFYGTYWHMI